ncbi:DoxX family protein [Bacillus safensis]|uniref:DoxX family protein n=1 Tax=Bacillus safensis TaxID=561879 RepID=UPI00041BE613|nr:DoxX family protein [Bacillus safensis]
MKRVLHIGSTYTFALLFIAAGIFHVIEPSGFARMMPGWPFPYVMVYATACLEWLLAVLLLLPNVRIAAAKSIAVYLVLISLQTYLLHVREYHFQVKKIQNKPCYG